MTYEIMELPNLLAAVINAACNPMTGRSHQEVKPDVLALSYAILLFLA
jgi:hypothetical protein